MAVKEILAIVGFIGAGYVFLGLTLGWVASLYSIGTILGFWLLFVGCNVIISRLSMHADESLAKAQAERQGQMHVHGAFAANGHLDEVADQRKHGDSIDAEFRIF